MHQERAVARAFALTGNWEDARDLAQEAFIRAYENLDGFKAESRFYTWYYRILSNVCKDHLRKKKVRAAISFFTGRGDEGEGTAEENIVDRSKNAKEALLDRELGQNLYKAVSSLPFRQKNAFVLRYMEDMSLEEIGETMQISTGAVKAHLWQAVKKMKDFLGSYAGTEGC